MKKRVIRKPWGGEEEFVLNKKCTVKILTVLPGKKLSLQYHHKRKEFWKVLDGPVKVWMGNRKITAKKGDEFVIKTGQKHRLEGLANVGKVLEISYGEWLVNDIVRLEDDYKREGKTGR